MTCLAVEMQNRDWAASAARLRLQRAARLAKQAVDAVEEKKQRIRDAIDCGSAQDFWDLVDSSGGADACHPWTGYVNSSFTVYDFGEFKLDGATTTLAHRLVCLLTYGSEPPKGMDVLPICGNHLCCNVRHLAIVRRGGQNKMDRAIPITEFFCEEQARAA